MASQDDDINMKKADQAAKYTLLQQRMQSYRQKLLDIQNREFTGKYQGITVRMTGDFKILSVNIAQSYYETAAKSALETAIQVCMSNLHSAIEQETKNLTEQMQQEMMRFQAENLDSTAN